MKFKTIFIIVSAIILSMNILYADQNLKEILEENISVKREEAKKVEKKLNYFIGISDLLNRVKDNPSKYSKPLLIILLEAIEKGNLSKDYRGAVYSFYFKNDPKFKKFIERKTFSLRINFKKGKYDESVALRFRDNFTLAMEKLGLKIIKKGGDLRIDQSISKKDQRMPSYLSSMTKMKSVRILSDMRIVSKKGKLLASWGISKATAHLNKDSAESRATVKLVKLSVNKMLKFFLEEYAK